MKPEPRLGGFEALVRWQHPELGLPSRPVSAEDLERLVMGDPQP